VFTVPYIWQWTVTASCSNTHKYEHTHTHTPTHTHANTHTCTYTHTLVHTYTCTRVKTEKEKEYCVVRARYGVRPYLEVNYPIRGRKGNAHIGLGRWKKAYFAKKKQRNRPYHRPERIDLNILYTTITAAFVVREIIFQTYVGDVVCLYNTIQAISCRLKIKNNEFNNK